MKGYVNIIYRIAAAVVMVLAASSAMTAQEYVSKPVEISKEKVRIDGKICYSHVVQEKQTLFSISKAYEVSVEDIYAFNPTLKETGLKKNSIIIIPSKDALKAMQNRQEARTKTEEKVVTEIPDTSVTEAKPQKNVPAAVEESPIAVKEAPSTRKANRIHIAKWYEDLDVIAEHYGVRVEDIMKANKLKGRKLGKRQKLIIPYPGDPLPDQTAQAADVPADVTAQTPAVQDTTAALSVQESVAAPKTKTSATLILPLTNAEGEPNRNNMDFYCGALLAIYDMAESGIDCNLNVFDIMDSKSQFSHETIRESDVVIGPISASDLTKFFYAVPDSKNVVSPLDPRAEKLTKEHTQMIQAPTPHVVLYKDLVRWIEEDFREGDQVVLITEKGARQSGITSQMKEALDSSSLAYNTFAYSILEGRDITEALISMMSTEGANRILVSSESEAFVNDVVRNLNLLIYNNLDIVLYAPSKIRSFETIEVENFHNTSMHVSLGYYTDYNTDAVKSFLMKYRALYNTEPTQFAFQGYDLMRYFAQLSIKYGDNWKEKLSESPEKMLQSTFNFVKTASGAHVNNGVRRIIYDKGYSIRQVR